MAHLVHAVAVGDVRLQHCRLCSGCAPFQQLLQANRAADDAQLVRAVAVCRMIIVGDCETKDDPCDEATLPMEIHTPVHQLLDQVSSARAQERLTCGHWLR